MTEKSPIKTKLLLVDSDIEFSKVLRFRLSNLRRSPFDVTLAANWQQALASLKKSKFDAIALDLFLPDALNIEVIDQIRVLSRDTPTIVMTELDDNTLAKEAVEKGAEDLVVKGDTNAKMFSRIILHAVERHKTRQKLHTVTAKLRQVNSQLKKYAVQDPLTEIYNRRGLQQILTREIHTAERKKQSLMALVLDLDNFKKVNDTLGHPAGDLVLKEIAQKLVDSIRISDYVGRIGGDEFVFLLPDTDMEAAIKLAKRIKQTISNANLLVSENRRIEITASIGLAKVTIDITSVDELLSLTDPLLQESKNTGKNKISYEDIHHSHVTTPNTTRSQIQELRDVSNFFALKQGIHALQDTSIVGYEFLTRMDQSQLEMPIDFFQVAVENDMMTLVDHHCFNTCLKASWLVDEAFIQHINLLPSTLMDIPIHKFIAGLTQNGHSYCIEISEQQILGNPALITEPIQRLKSYGVQIAVDDVGFGHTCLENLLYLEPDVMKIDKKCVQDISNSKKKQRAVKHLLNIALEMSSKVIAEGIETQQELDCLREIGVQYGQGYFLSMPA